jgi:L-threonylcarbamoyladenylate synthase
VRWLEGSDHTELLQQVVRVWKAGGLVAFPTETVYGLGADALQASAVAGIFAAKGRPSSNPVIVHVSSVEQARSLTPSLSSAAETLMNRFWPGPLTLVVQRADCVPSEVSAGGTTVALRMPVHPVAQALLRAYGRPIAAPSANVSTQISPTTADHVLASLAGRIELIVDGGACSLGIESTVIDVSHDQEQPVVLRPGSLSREELSAALGYEVPLYQAPVPNENGNQEALTHEIARSPGQQARHYAPSCPLELVVPSELQERVSTLKNKHERVFTIGCTQHLEPGIQLGTEPERYAARLYDTLRQAESQADWIVVELPPSTVAWEAIHDRLHRAAQP